MMDYQRLQLEKQVLARKLPASAYVFQDMNTSKPYILLGAVTNSKNIYTIRIDLDQFPNEVPKAFVTKMLLAKTGSRMDSASATMHTLSSEHGLREFVIMGITHGRQWFLYTRYISSAVFGWKCMKHIFVLARI